MIEGISIIYNNSRLPGFGRTTFGTEVFWVIAQLEGGIGSICRDLFGGAEREDQDEALRCNHTLILIGLGLVFSIYWFCIESFMVADGGGHES
jgi:hypothetical protein